MYGPGMAAQIQDTVANCQICSSHQQNNSKEPMLTHEIPTSQVGTDLFEINNQKYLVMVDYYSGFNEISLLQNGTTSKKIVTHSKLQLSRHGISDKLITDNGRHSITTFKAILSRLWIPAPNSKCTFPAVEWHGIQTAKNLIKKTILDKGDPYLALLEYRNTL